MMRRFSTVVLAAAVATGALPGVAGAAHLVIEVSGPQEVIVGEELEIGASVHLADGTPVPGATVVFFADSFFAGVSGEIRLGSVVTNDLGVATFPLAFSVRGVHRVRLEVGDGTETQQAGLTIGVNNGPQIVASEAGVEIPGLGSWLVTLVIASVWAVMILAAFWMMRVSRAHGEGDEVPTAPEDEQPRDRRRRPGLNVAVMATAVMVLVAVGLVAVLIRSPETHHNLDPEGYGRSPVAYLDAAYVYPGPGLVDDGVLTGDVVADGRALFLKLGCAGCHGIAAQGAASARSPAFATRQWLGTVVRTGLPGGMPAYAVSDLSDADLDIIHTFLLDARDALADEAPVGDGGSPPTPATTTTMADSTSPAPSFADVRQVLEPNCSSCHGTFGGWSADDYDSVVNSGDNGPAVIPGDPLGSILAQKLLGTQTFGSIMPPGGSLSDSDIRLIVDWIAAGAAP
jgi:mono/diheme cytochrome c family protein